jgi:hypothetical protein
LEKEILLQASRTETLRISVFTPAAKAQPVDGAVRYDLARLELIDRDL